MIRIEVLIILVFLMLLKGNWSLWTRTKSNSHQRILLSSSRHILVDEKSTIERTTRQWVENWIIRHNLCPWAASTFSAEKMRVMIIEGRYRSLLDRRKLLRNIVEECKLLQKSIGENTELKTTLLVLPQLRNFTQFLQFIEKMEGLLVDKQLDRDIQLASFHPHYQFAGTKSEDVENYTNRSPYPILHLLSVKQVHDAIASVQGNTEKIWQRNVQLMKDLGDERIQQLQQDIIRKDV
jgi:uncharacterized protein